MKNLNFPIVHDIAGNWCIISTPNEDYVNELLNLGFNRIEDFEKKYRLGWKTKIDSQENRIKLINFLSQLGFLFSSGKDWSPEALVSYYKEQGLIVGVYKVISWNSPVDYEIYAI